MTSASGVRARRLPSRTVMLVPWYSSLTGITRRSRRTERIREMSIAWSAPCTASRSSLMPVTRRTRPKSRNVQSKLEHLRPEGDEHAAQQQGADHTDQQDPLLQRLGHGEGGQQEHEDEQVVDGERLLDEVAGVVLDADAGAVLAPHPRAEGEGERRRTPTTRGPHAWRPREAAG